MFVFETLQKRMVHVDTKSKPTPSIEVTKSDGSKASEISFGVNSRQRDQAHVRGFGGAGWMRACAVLKNVEVVCGDVFQGESWRPFRST